MADPIPGTGVYTWYYTLTNDEYTFLHNNGYDTFLGHFKQYTDGMWYAPKDSVDTTEYNGITASGIEFGEAWFTRSTEPNIFP